MKIAGTIRDAVSNSPLERAKITLEIEGDIIGILISDPEGLFEYVVMGDFIGQTLTCKAEKEGYDTKIIEYDIEESDLTFEIEMVPVGIRVEGTVMDSTSKTALDNVKLDFSVGTETTTLHSDFEGRFGYLISANNIGKDLICNIEKEGYKRKRITYQEIEEKVINLPIELIRK